MPGLLCRGRCPRRRDAVSIPGTMSSMTTTFADLTTIGVGGPISSFIEPADDDELIDSIRRADGGRIPLAVIGGGSNILVADEPFDGVVLRDARRGVSIVDGGSTGSGGNRVRIKAQAGCVWDDLVDATVSRGWHGIEGLSGIPGTVGASVVQNIGAYGQEVATSVRSVRVWDRAALVVRDIEASRMGFGYRTSMLKHSMYQAPGVPDRRFFPTPRFVVLAVEFELFRTGYATVGYGQLAKALGVEVGAEMEPARVRTAVLSIRGAKGMLEDARRYDLAAMRGMRAQSGLAAALSHQKGLDEESLADRHSCGSFFVNPVLPLRRGATLPPEAPRFEAVLPDGSPGVKTSAAWLIEHSGFAKGFRVTPQARVSLSTRHTLALTNRGGATAEDVAVLARTVAAGVLSAFKVDLMPEPVIVGVDVP